MLLGLKVTVYNIAIRPSKIPKGSLDYNLHILICAVSLDYLTVPFLR
jgi:hypothetical protein